MRRLIAGFLFAVVIIVIGHFGAWFIAANHSQKQILASFDALPQLNISYQSVIPKGYPNQVRLDVRGLKVHWQNQEDGKNITLHIPKVSVETPLFDMRKAIVDFSKEFSIDIHDKEEVIRSFRVISEGARFSSFIRPDNTAEHAMNVSNLTLWDKQIKDAKTPALRIGPSYLVREEPGIRSPVSWRISIQNLNAADSLMGQAFTLNRLVTIFGFKKDFFSTYGTELLSVFSKTPAGRNAAKEDLAQKLTQTSRLPRVVIDSMQIEKDENWVSLRGDFGLNSKHYLDGRLSLNANNISPIIAFMAKAGFIKANNAKDTQRIQHAVEQVPENGNLSIIFERDRTYINSKHVVHSPNVRELLE